jgi:hypothetical protein
VFIHPPRQPGNKFPNYGQGQGPVYFTGQSSWYAASQEGLFLVDSKYTGALTVTGQQNGTTLNATFGGVPVLHIPTGSSGPYWRSWSGQVSFADPGCYTITVTGTGVSDHIVVYVHPGPLPPG